MGDRCGGRWWIGLGKLLRTEAGLRLRVIREIAGHFDN